MRHLGLIGYLILAVASLAGCARNTPPISHAHIGHALTTWRDTPQQQGLFVVAEQALTSATLKTRRATELPPGSARARANFSAVVHALNPDRNTTSRSEPSYGVIRALQGAIDHVEFAATSEDASDNIRGAVPRFSALGATVIDRLHEATLMAEQAASEADPGRGKELGESLIRLLQHARTGADVDGDGQISSTPDESGIAQLRDLLSEMVNAEKPRYTPLGDKYLLGIIRLPDGNWAYRFDSSANGLDGSDSSY